MGITAIILLAVIGYVYSQQCGSPAFPPIESWPKEEVKDENGNSRIVGGRIANANSWPWQLSFRIASSNQHICGASILTNSWAITAAHCVNDNPSPSRYALHAGRHYKDISSTGIQTSGASRVIIHPSYNPRTFDNDIAMIKLSSPFAYTSYVLPVCLPGYDVVTNQLAFVTGWGDTMGTGGDGVLKQVGVPVVDPNTCRSWYPNAVTNNMICGGYENGGHDSCQGDSGGPFVTKHSSGQWQLNGIVSWGQGCAGYRRPGVYTRVINYNNWIQQVIANN